jgi:hypothetical protein
VKFSRYLLGLAVLVGIYSTIGIGRLFAQSPTLVANRTVVSTGKPALPPSLRKSSRISIDATASIDPDTGALFTISCHKGSFERLGLRHDQAVDVSVQFATAGAGQAIAVEALDGGQIIGAAKNLIVGPDGAIHFKFRAGHTPGLYQVALRNGSQELGLQFWVADEANPRNNPPVLNAGN